MVHLEAENGKEQIYFHRDNTLTECVICVKKCELEQMITNFLICFRLLKSNISETFMSSMVSTFVHATRKHSQEVPRAKSGTI